MRTLILGSDTALGLALAAYFSERERDYVALPLAECRWKGERQAKKGLRRSACEVVVDTRMQASADGGITIFEVDVQRSVWLARACQVLKIPLVLMSSSAVFSGRADLPYAEQAQRDNPGTLGALLTEAENAVIESADRHVILRMGALFAPRGLNVITHMMAQLHSGEPLVLRRNRLGCPVSVDDAARVISGMLDQFGCGLDAWGVYHYCSADITNCYEFAEVLLAAASQYRELPLDAALLSEPELSEAEAAVAAVVNLQLDCNKIRNTFAIKQQPWRASVAGHIKQYYLDMTEELDGHEGYRQHDASA